MTAKPSAPKNLPEITEFAITLAITPNIEIIDDVICLLKSFLEKYHCLKVFVRSKKFAPFFCE